MPNSPALLTEAHASRVTEVRVTSAWRPCKGSIAHRAGLGLDINFVKDDKLTVKVNREWLTIPKGRGKENVTLEEKRLYTEFENAKQDRAIRERELNEVNREVKRTKDPIEKTRLQEKAKAANEELDQATVRHDDAKAAWNKERNENERILIRSLRTCLSKNPWIKQLLDPWYIDYNTQDNLAASPNEQRDGTEKGHRDHLHITVREPKILP